MASSDNIFGTTASVSGNPAVEAVQAEELRRVQAEQDQQAAAHPADSGKVSWGTLGTPFPGSRYTGQADGPNSVPYSPPMPAPVALGPAPVPALPRTPASYQYTDYEAARRMQQDILQDAQNLYTSRGDFNLVGTPQFQSEVQSAWQSVGLGVAPEKELSPFQQARAQAEDLTADLRDTYALQGRFGEIGQASFQKDLTATLSQAGLGQPETDESALHPYAAAQKRRAGIEAMVRDDYTLRGDGGKIGTAEYRKDIRSEFKEAGVPEPGAGGSYKDTLARKAEMEASFQDELTEEGKFAEIGTGTYKKQLRSRLVDAGLAEKDTVWNRIKEDKTGIAFGVGYSAMSVGSGGAELAKMNDGQFHTQEQVATAQFNTFAPAGFGIAGTLIGTAVGGAAGGLAGQFVGGAVGQVASATFGAGEERAQSERQSAETLAHSLGEAASSVAAFKSQIEATGAPVQQFAASLSAAGQVGTFSAGTVAGIGALTNSFGERAGEDYQAIGKYTANPLLHGLGNRVSSGQAGSGDLQSLGFDAAENGDFAGLKTFQQAAQDARVKDNPVYQEAAKRLQGDSSSLFGLGALGVAGTKFLRDHGYRPNSDINADLQMEDDQKAASGTDPVTAAQNALINQFADLKSRDIVAGSTIKTARAGIALVEAQGGSAQDIARSSQSLFSADAAGRAATASEVTLLQTDLANPVNAGRRDELTARIADAQSRLASYNVADAQLVQANNAAIFDQNAAAFGRTNSTQQAALEAGFYGGRTFAQLQGSENSILSTEQARAAQLRREAYAPNVDPAERDKKLAEATGMDAGVVKERHDFQLSRYSQNLAQTDLQAGQAALAVSTAQITGGPQDVYGARGQELDAYKAKIAELGNELARGGLTVDERIGKERELTDTRRQAAQASFSRDQSVMNDQYQLTGTGEQALEVGQSRRIRRGGNAAFDPALLAAGQARTSEAQSHLDFDLAHYGGNKQLLADDRLRVAQAGEDYQGLLDTKNDYRPTGAFARQMASDRTAFEVALQAPYIRGGAESDPLTRGNAVIKDIRQDMAPERSKRLRGQRDGTWTDDNETAYSDHRNQDALQLASMEKEKRFALFNAVPNTIIGGGAVGNSVQSFSFDALTAAYAPNELVGSRGRPNIPRGGELPGSVPGNRVEAFQQHAASSGSGPASLTTAIQGLAHGLNTQQLAVIMQQVLQTLQRMETANRAQMPGQGGPPLTGGSRTIQNNRQSFNSNRPSL